jgi:hypothetical protein
MPLALAAPDKADVAGVWTYRTAEIEQLGIPLRTGVAATADDIRRFNPDLVMVATGAKPRGLTLIFGVMRMVNFAEGQSVMIGAFVALTAAPFIGYPDRLAGGAAWTERNQPAASPLCTTVLCVLWFHRAYLGM